MKNKITITFDKKYKGDTSEMFNFLSEFYKNHNIKSIHIEPINNISNGCECVFFEKQNGERLITKQCDYCKEIEKPYHN